MVRACAIVLLLAAVPAAIAQSDSARQQWAERELQNGEAALTQGRFADAKQHFEAAENQGGPPSPQINAGIAIAELQMGNFEAARNREYVVLKLVSSDRERAEAYNVIGTSWWRESEGSKAPAASLQGAEIAFRRAVEIDPVFDAAFFSLGKVLLQEGRSGDAEETFKKFIDAAARNPKYAQNTVPSPLRPTPDYAIADQNGRTLSKNSLHGRVVLFDFWATWCPPCIKALPAIHQLASYFPGGQFVLISVNEDSDQTKWKRFTAQEKMDWTQVWDKNADLYHSFALAAPPEISIPRYVLVDEEGHVRRVFDGTDRLGSVMALTVRMVEEARSKAADSNHGTR